MTPLVLLIIIGAYLLGSISSAVLISRLYRLPDPRDSGSGNPGATNVLRLGGKSAASMVLVCDVLKGMLPVWLSYFLNINPFLLGIIGIAACLGHIYPIFFHFRGGKGVATALGALAPIGWDLSGMLIGTWLLTVFITGYSSLGSLITALAAPLLTWFVKPEYTMAVSMLSCLIVLRHHDNLRRLFEGKETKIWQKISRKAKLK
ncbi:glycerol-3-phosphate 1-O-acyltransferase PlsY [Photobacterium profundum]|uniref:Glycerol-3-phosphate acyltransferase n=1 Tax=Photobacterium profundum (strain SS9) TaxID=298386 RepID=PLSY_PHOPR|nr:glycerol-3-phosphate 1-O-acyltransferase PlsY [Photobacterium profundum]Q6LV09.1 RecName: Full=Glycerol-3-phosphate acyltransferase; AltName: Full=Acyl-PO4 G3P acyltransferase; AltName: Full=Acyl-phosphate--glycerol-3-phosphate acyltransferase; AltName: Full=G3P acyltransferase; Short=GPAT; AltName: Full=Lysophosphatidic acid synthase; Short=LPA synthase [Photobacterium profundum SS9]CAG18866.1 putative membrane protein [Photobacterium profundum SS9]